MKEPITVRVGRAVREAVAVSWIHTCHPERGGGPEVDEALI